MKTKSTIFLLSALTGLFLATPVFGQIIIQHLGANDPVSAGFTEFSVGEAQLGPVSDDFGFDSWKVHSRVPIESATYRYGLTPDELQASLTHGWVLTANLRFVEVTGSDWVLIEFYTETRGFGLRLSGTDEGELFLRYRVGDPLIPIEMPLAYHEYQLVYDAVSELAALWVDGTELLTGISGFSRSGTSSVFFGASGESVTYSHWNEVTFEVIPEPATVALLVGIGALLLVAGTRWRRGS